MIAPGVRSVAEAQNVVAAAKYPPLGSRGLSTGLAHLGFRSVPAAEALPAMNAATMVIVQLESAAALAAIEGIVALEGVDMVLIGTNDLLADLGRPGEYDHPKVREAYERALSACKKQGPRRRSRSSSSCRSASTRALSRLGGGRCGAVSQNPRSRWEVFMRWMLLAAVFCATSAFAQPYPVKPIRIVVPLVPGGNQDIVARAVAEELSKGLGQQVIVENRPGQSAIIGTQFVKTAPPDGYTLLSVAVTFARVPVVVKAAGYDPEITKVTGKEDFRKKYLERDIELVASRSPEELGAYVKSEAEAFARLVREAGIRVE